MQRERERDKRGLWFSYSSSFVWNEMESGCQ